MQSCDKKTIAPIDWCIALAHSAFHHAQHGNMKKALKILNNAKKHFPSSYSQSISKEWINTLGWILFDASYYRYNMNEYSGEYENAREVLDCWTNYASDDRLITLTCDTKRAQLLHRLGNTFEARQILETVISNNDNRTSFRARRINAFLLLADIHLESRIQAGPLSAMSLLFTCISLAEKYEMKLLHNLALLRFAHVLLHLEYPTQAAQILQQIMPFLLTHADVESQGLAAYTRALCILATTNEFVEASNALFDAIHSILKFN